MTKPLSIDLRVRVLAAVQAGASHREAAERYDVSAASVSRWRKREQGDPRAKALGGDRRSRRVEAHQVAVMAALGPDESGALFRTIGRGTGRLSDASLPQANAYQMIRRRAAAAGIGTKIGNHTFRATGITA